jgi:hypothetical protein
MPNDKVRTIIEELRHGTKTLTELLGVRGSGCRII